MSRVVSTAGRAGRPDPQASKRAVIAKIRRALRDSAAKDDDVDQALEALVELAKTED